MVAPLLAARVAATLRRPCAEPGTPGVSFHNVGDAAVGKPRALVVCAHLWRWPPFGSRRPARKAWPAQCLRLRTSNFGPSFASKKSKLGHLQVNVVCKVMIYWG